MALWVAPAHIPFARRQLARLETQARAAAERRPTETPLAAIWSSLIVTGGLALLHYLITLQADGDRFFASFGAVDHLIRSGELHRSVTALLLHSSVGHLLSNAAALLLFGPVICRRFGHGWGWLLVLMSGVGGNCLNAWVRKTPQLFAGPHLSVGASTAVFGAVGILVAVNLYRRGPFERGRWRRWTPIAGGLGFLAFMGSAPGSDILAHLFGFLVGLGVGGIAGLERLPSASAWRQAMATGAALALLVWAWARGIALS